MKPILKQLKNQLGINGNYYIWWNDQFELNNETKIIVAHDGQNLFDFQEKEKKLSLQLDVLLKEFNLNVMIIGIESSNDWYQRFSILGPCKPSKTRIDADVNQEAMNQVKALGIEYLKFVKNITDLEINEYQLFNNQKFMLGASMGGYISLYAASMNEFQDFDKFLCFSTAVWFNKEFIFSTIEKVTNKEIFIGVGDNENRENPERDYLNNSILLSDKLKINNDVYFYELKNGMHQWNSWKKFIIENIFMFSSNHFAIDWKLPCSESGLKQLQSVLIKKYTTFEN